jgi:plastocyanin
MRAGRLLTTVVATSLVPLALAPGALADKQVQAQPVDAYSGDVTMDQGEALTFFNGDVNNHDVTADGAGSDGKPLFASATIGTGQSSKVEGSQYLTTGDYKFHCTLHPFMTATIHVTSSGTPQPRPGSGGGSGGGGSGGGGGSAGGGDTTSPTVSLKVSKVKLSALRKKGKLPVKVTVSEGATVFLAANVGKTSIASGKATFDKAGSKTVTLKLSSAGRKALKKKKSAKVAVDASASDAAGNKGAGSGSAKLSG